MTAARLETAFNTLELATVAFRGGADTASGSGRAGAAAYDPEPT
jgi:hypothetical protein